MKGARKHYYLVNLLRHLQLIFRSAQSCHRLVCFWCLLWLACWFGLSCSTWRSWPLSTSATARSSTVWASWSTWRVSMAGGQRGGTQPTLHVQNKQHSVCSAAGKGILWTFMWWDFMLFVIVRAKIDPEGRLLDPQLLPRKAQFHI